MFHLLISLAMASDLSGCLDPFGKPVPTVEASFSPHVAMSSRRKSGEIAIVINNELITKFSPTMQKIIYWHECGHVALGHLDRGPITSSQEQNADCFGIRTAITLGHVQLKEVTNIQSAFASLGAGDKVHLNGSDRAINLTRCLNEELNERSWKKCKLKYYDYLELIDKATTRLNQLATVCNNAGARSSNCSKAKKLGRPITEAVVKCITELDHDCPYIVDPKFSKTMHDYHGARLRLAP